MLETAIAQLRFGMSMALGTRLHVPSIDRILAAMEETKREFGALGEDADEMLSGPVLDEATRTEVQLRRFRRQARRAADETDYYARLLGDSGLNPDALRAIDLASLPTTTKEHLRTEPDAFVARSARPVLRATTTGTTGRPASVYFSEHELAATASLTALGFANHGQVEPEDVVAVSMSPRAQLVVSSISRACAKIGALAQVVGILEPEHTLALLTERRHLDARRGRVSVLATYPSYLGEIVEHGLACGLGREDFGLRQIMTGGEMLTAGLRRRCHELFGDHVRVGQVYGITELAPFGGNLCSQGHLHFEPSGGLLEVQAIGERRPADPGELGTVVATPLPPYRETSILLRYDSEDVVRRLERPPECELRALPATSHLRGKLSMGVRHDGGWTFPREVAEALEGLDHVPLPARHGFWPLEGGVAVEVCARRDSTAARRAIGEALEAADVPVRRLTLTDDAAQLERPRPLRCDLKQYVFDGGRPLRTTPTAAEEAS